MSVPPAPSATPPRGTHDLAARPRAPRARTVLRAASVLIAAASLVATSAAVATAAPRDAGSTDSAATPAGRYFAISPARVLDTRTTNAPFRQGESRVVDLSKAFTANASAVVLNLTAVSAGGSGYLAAYPAGTAFAGTSSLNFTAGAARANAVTVAVGSGAYANEVSVLAAVLSGTVHVLVDVVGYYGAAGSATAGTDYQPLAAPVRLFDTRSSIGALTASYPKNVGIVTIDYGSPAVNRTISAVAMNLTATEPAAGGYLAVWNGFGPAPATSAVNYGPSQTVANMAIAPVRCTDSACNTITFSILNGGSPSTQVVGDIAGAYMTPSTAGLLFTPMSPKRVTDSRMPMPYSRLGAGGTGTTSLTASVPAGAVAVTVNLTAVSPTSATYLSLFPQGVTRPGVSSINVVPGDIAANAAQVRLGGGGITAYNNLGWTDILIDLSGTFSRDTTPAAKAATATGGASVSGAVAGG